MRDRGVSVVVNYVMILGIVALLVSGLFLTMSGFVESQREQAVRSELQVVGNKVATDLTVVGQLARTTTGAGTITLSTKLPERVAGTPYKITIDDDGDGNRYELTLKSLDPEVVVTVHVRTASPITNPVTVDGGNLELSCDPECDEVVVEHA